MLEAVVNVGLACLDPWGWLSWRAVANYRAIKKLYGLRMMPTRRISNKTACTVLLETVSRQMRKLKLGFDIGFVTGALLHSDLSVKVHRMFSTKSHITLWRALVAFDGLALPEVLKRNERGPTDQHNLSRKSTNNW